MTLPPPPQTQARRSTTFKAPLLDGSVTLPEIYDWHLHNSPIHRLFILTGDDGIKRTIHWSNAIRAIHIGAKIIHDLTGGRSGSIVAIISASGYALSNSRTPLTVYRNNLLLDALDEYHAGQLYPLCYLST